MAVQFVNLPSATLNFKVQNDVEGNIWRNDSGVEKGAYKKMSFEGVSPSAAYDELWEDNGDDTAFTHLLHDVLGIYPPDNDGEISRELGQVNEDDGRD